MRGTFFLVLCLVACGNVNKDEAIDAPIRDAPGTCSGTTIEACGASCDECTVTSDREEPTCNGTTCGSACKAGAPTCSDDSCSRLLWAFDSLMLDGITPRAPAALALAVRNHLGNPAMAIDLASLTEVSFRVPLCLSGTIDLSQRTFSFDVFFEGGSTQGEQYFVQASIPSPMNGAFIGQRPIQAGVSVTYTAAIAMSTFGDTATEATIQAGTLGAAFAGTIWIDNIKVE